MLSLRTAIEALSTPDSRLSGTQNTQRIRAYSTRVLRISSSAELCETHRRTEAQRRRGEAVRAALCPRLRRSHARGAGRPRTHSQFEQPIQMCHLRSCRLLRPELRLPVGPLRHDLQRARHGGVRLGRTGSQLSVPHPVHSAVIYQPPREPCGTQSVCSRGCKVTTVSLDGDVASLCIYSRAPTVPRGTRS
jgi:hypothetical protein